jgi:drug/metabolite transporter (DMT)-like permease
MANRSTLAGILGVVLGLGALLAQDVIMKTLSAHYSVIQLMFMRGVFALLALYCLLPILFRGQFLQSNRKGMQILRGSLQFLSFSCYYIALKSMPILDLVTIFFSAPLIAVALSAWILKERVSVRHWIAVSLGFVGALLMIGPSGSGLDQGIALFALGAAVLYAGSIVVTRILGESDQGVVTAHYTLIMYAVLAGFSVLVMEFIVPAVIPQGYSPAGSYWVAPAINHAGLLLVAGIAVCISFLLLAHAYRQVPVSILVPWEYSALIWGGLFGYLFWNELPSIITVLGAALIVSSGIYIARHSR